METLTLILFFSSCALLVLSVLFFPSLKIGKARLSTFYLIPLVFAILMIALGPVSLSDLKDSFLSNSSINPVKILLLFLSMTGLSVFLDEVGFFSFLAEWLAIRFDKNQKVLFLAFYILISLLTVFTSNDIIILTFTPFLIYFCSRNKIDPIPYLIMEFISANTFSMLFIIGNPTNIYLSSAYKLDFLSYLSVMWLPTLFCSLTSFVLLFLMFHKKLDMPLSPSKELCPHLRRVPLIVGLVLLFSTTLLLALSDFLNIEMYLVSLVAFFILLLFCIFYSIHEKENYVLPLLKKLPYTLIPFVLSMFVLVIGMKKTDFYSSMRSFLLGFDTTFSYGISSALASNLINNIPMAVFFEGLLDGAPVKALYATIISSNLSAYLTPMGALAGIMFLDLCKSHGVRIDYLKFLRYSLPVGIPTLAVALLVLRFLV